MAKECYAHRAHRQKYKLGYGAEGAARGKQALPVGEEAPKDKSWKEANNEAYLEKEVSKKSPNPY